MGELGEADQRKGAKAQRRKEDLSEAQRQVLDEQLRHYPHFDENLQEWLYPAYAFYIGQEIWNGETRTLVRWDGERWQVVDPHEPSVR